VAGFADAAVPGTGGLATAGRISKLKSTAQALHMKTAGPADEPYGLLIDAWQRVSTGSKGHDSALSRLFTAESEMIFTLSTGQVGKALLTLTAEG